MNDRLDTVLNRAVAEQLAEQRGLRDALEAIGARLDRLERSIGDQGTTTEQRLEALRDAVAGSEERTAEVVADASEHQLDLLALRLDSLAGSVTALQARLDDIAGPRLTALKEATATSVAAAADASRDTILAALVAREQQAAERFDAVREALLSAVNHATELIVTRAEGRFDDIDKRAERDLEGILTAQAQLDERQAGRSDAVRAAAAATAETLTTRMDAIRDALRGSETRIVERVAAEAEVTAALVEGLRPTIEAIVRSAVTTEVDRAVLDVRAAVTDLGRLFVSLAEMLQTAGRRPEEPRQLAPAAAKKPRKAPAKKAPAKKAGSGATKAKAPVREPSPSPPGEGSLANGHRDADAEIVDAEVVDLTDAPAEGEVNAPAGEAPPATTGRRLRPLRARRARAENAESERPSTEG